VVAAVAEEGAVAVPVAAAEEEAVVAGSPRGILVSRRRVVLVAVLAVLLLALCLPGTVHAQQERIISYDSAIAVNRDGSMRVEETIRVYAGGIDIRRGIYRDYPTIYANPRTGGRMVVDFTVIGIQKDGQPEKWRVENRANGKRVYIGDADIMLSPGEYTYTIRYQTDRQLGYFQDHDELYWNVTGTGWLFTIERATATITLPDGAARAITALQAYTGVQGAEGAAFTTTQSADGTPTFTTTAQLGPHEGLTIVVAWPKGFVEPPTAGMRLKWFLRDNSALLVGVAGLIALLLYYMSVWYRFGKDPARGTIIPRFTPPPGMSPGGTRYLAKLGHDNKAFAAALIDMAVKKFLTIHQEGRKYWVERSTGVESLLSDDELIIAGTLLAGVDRFEFDQVNSDSIRRAYAGSKNVLEHDYQPRFFVNNTGYFVLGVVISVLVSALTFFLAIQATATQVIPLIAVPLLAAGMDVLFGWLLKSYTVDGRRLMDEVEGFKLYLSVTEKDRMNMLNPPERTPELFERCLPFALALDVEQRWAEQFATVFATMEAEGRPYAPAWYYGMYWNAHNPAAFASNVGSGFSNAIASSSIAPGSNSGLLGGGGGGFSGGGGGGGGGGGW
jgi:uncharacterized membrane protein YgcG